MNTGAGRHRLRLAINLALAVGALWLSLAHVDLQEISDALAVVSGLWIFLALLSVIATLLAGVVRWRLLFYPQQGARSWRNLAYGLLIGQSINIVLPLRLGEVARVFSVSAAESIPPARVLATIAVERVADLVVLGIATLSLLMLVTLPGWMRVPSQAIAATALVVGGALALVALRGGWIAGVLYRVAGRLPDRSRAFVTRHVADAAAGLAVLGSLRASAALWGLSAGIFLLAAGTNYLLFKAFGLPLPAIAALFLLVVLQVGTTAVPVPGNIGVFHYVTVLALQVYGIEQEPALAYAIVLWAVALLPKIVLGAAIMAAGPKGFSFRAVLARPGAVPQ